MYLHYLPSNKGHMGNMYLYLLYSESQNVYIFYLLIYYLRIYLFYLLYLLGRYATRQQNQLIAMILSFTHGHIIINYDLETYKSPKLGLTLTRSASLASLHNCTLSLKKKCYNNTYYLIFIYY
uniref:Uncharacterized protein n=1 Tax=Cacopsylla melanoneura TaxID=428564 RepID=A0A8D9FGX4_9HEMI